MFTQHAAKEMGQIIRKARTGAKLTQAALATKLGYSSPQFVSNWERGKALPPFKTLPKIARQTKTEYNAYWPVLVKDLEKTLNKGHN